MLAVFDVQSKRYVHYFSTPTPTPRENDTITDQYLTWNHPTVGELKLGSTLVAFVGAYHASFSHPYTRARTRTGQTFALKSINGKTEKNQI